MTMDRIAPLPLLLSFVLTTGAAENQPAFIRPQAVDAAGRIGDKTLVAWCQPDQTAYQQGGGGVLTIQEGGRFDNIVLGEIKPGVWMAGSELSKRTKQDQADWPETDDTGGMVQIAVVHRGDNVKIYRKSDLYAEHTVDEPVAYGASSEVLIGWRHFGAGPGSFFSGRIEEARIYDQALDQEVLRDLRPGTVGSPAPLAMWTFEDGSLADRMGRFGEGRLNGKAAIREGCLHLGGNGDFFAVKAMPTRYERTLHFRPEGGPAGDAIPFHYDGQYHVFYLRNKEWAHIVSRDLVNWAELPAALKADETNSAGPDAEACWTGSIVAKDGTFHLFYTGKNLRDPLGDQKVMVATSSDLIHWTKKPASTFYGDGKVYWSKPVNGPIDPVPYHHQAFRDPAVFWNNEAGEWWMLLHAVKADGSAPAMGLYASQDLLSWTPREPLLTYPMALSGDCPDLFELGGDWYIINGNYEYTWAPELAGPWSRNFAPYDTGDLRVAKTMFDGKRRILVGWIGDCEGDRDAGKPQWGGHLSMPRELHAPAPGKLGQRPVAEVVAAFSRRVATLPDGTPPPEALSLPRDFMLHTSITQASPDARAEIVFRRPAEAAAGGYHLRVDFGTREIELGGQHKQHRQVCDFDPARPLDVRLFVIGTVVECFINDRYAFTMRAYDYHGPQMLVRALQGSFQLQGGAIYAQRLPDAASPVRSSPSGGDKPD
jgi:sucrose-6-phosphate hydrolase SacC (GH32 family)